MPFDGVNFTAFGETVHVDTWCPQGTIYRIPSTHQVFMHPRDLLLLHVELCPTTYERKCTMRGRVKWEQRRRETNGTPVSDWPALARWAGVPAQ